MLSFDVILSLEKGSYGLCTSNIDFLGKNNGKIDLYISDSSTLFANQIITHRKFNPNFSCVKLFLSSNKEFELSRRRYRRFKLCDF